MADERAVSVELQLAVQRFLHKEARLLDEGLLRDWLEQLVDPQIAYRVVIREERFLRDKPIESSDPLMNRRGARQLRGASTS